MKLAALLALLGPSPFIVPPPPGAAKAVTSVAACGQGDTTCFDKNGVIGGVASGTTDPLGVMVRGKQ